MTCQKFSGETKAKQEGSLWKKERPSLPKLAKPRQTGRGALWKTKFPPCSWMKNMQYKVTSRYTAKYLARSYEYRRFSQKHVPSKLGQFSRQGVVRDRGCCSSGTWNNWATAVIPESWPSNRRTASDRAVALYKIYGIWWKELFKLSPCISSHLPLAECPYKIEVNLPFMKDPTPITKWRS